MTAQRKYWPIIHITKDICPNAAGDDFIRINERNRKVSPMLML